MKKEVMILTGAGQIGMAIARRIGYGMKIILGDKSLKNAEAIAETMDKAGFDTVAVEMNLASRESILSLISEAQKHGEIAMLINAAGVSPSQASIETILKVDLYGTAVLLEEVGKVIKNGGTGVTISSQSGCRLSLPKWMNCSLRHPPNSSSRSMYFNLLTSATRFTPTRWPNAVM